MANEFKIENGLIVNGNMSASGAIIANTLTALSIIITGSLVGTPEMYGAVGDGITDDQLSFKHALISHSLVELSAKTYAIRGFLGMPSYRTLRGKGKDKTIIKVMDNSPYGYGHALTVIQNTFFQDTIYWLGSTIGTSVGSGSVDVDHRDTAIVDKAPDSPLYNQSQTQDWAGLGYWSYDTGHGGLVGARKNVIIEDLTIDCNFNNQAKHSSWNHANNPSSASNGGGGHYVPRYSWKVRPTVHAIELSGENIVVNNVKVINYGYGVGYAAAAPLDHANSATYPVYLENFPILLGGNNNLNYTSSNTNDLITDGVGDSKFKGNYVLNSEVLDIANVDLMNPFSNTTAIYVTNQSVNNSTGLSTFSSEGGIYNCTVNPGDNYKPTVGAFFAGSYLDEYTSSSLKQSAPSLIEWLSAGGSSTGSNGDYAILNGPMSGGNLAKKISGSWYYVGAVYATQQHSVQAYSGYRVFNSTAKHISIGFYLDSWRNNAYVENNQFIDVDSGFRSVVSDISLTSSYNNVVIKNNYVKLARHDRSAPSYIFGHGVIFYGIDRSTSSGSILRHIDNLVIENNIFELPISSSKSIYQYPPFVFREYPRYVGLWFTSEVYPSGSQPNLHRSVLIKNNNFVNWNPVKSELITGGEAYGYNVPFFFNYSTSSADFDTSDNPAGPFPNSLIKFKNKTLSNYIIEGNIYNDSIYPSTSSIVPITFNMVGTGNQYYYPVDQVSRLGSVTATTSMTSPSGNFTNLTSSNISASGNVSASTVAAATSVTSPSGNFTNLTSSNITASGFVSASTINAVTSVTSPIGFFTNTTSSNVSASGFVSASTIRAVTSMTSPIGFFTNTTSSNISASGFVSASTIRAVTSVTSPIGFFTNTTSSNISASGFVSASTVVINGTLVNGSSNVASGVSSHAEGYQTTALGNYSHAEGWLTTAEGIYSHAEGYGAVAFGANSHAEGYAVSASGGYSHAEGLLTLASGAYSHAEGHGSVFDFTTAEGNYSHAEGEVTLAAGSSSHAEGYYTTASADYSHAEGSQTKTFGDSSHAEGYQTITHELAAHAEGWGAEAFSPGSHAEGYYTKTLGDHSHAEGYQSTASGISAHAEGQGTFSSGSYSHAEGFYTSTSGESSHAEGERTRTLGLASHSEGTASFASASYSHAEGMFTTASGVGQHVSGKYNVTSSNTNDLFIIGNGTSTAARSNILVVNTSSVIVSGNISSSGFSALNITASNISASGFVSASTVAAATSVTSPSGNFTNLTASNISASGFVSASTIRAVTSMTSPIGNFTNLTASNISSSGTSSLNVIEISASSNILYKIGKGSAIYPSLYTGELVIANVNPATGGTNFPLVISQSRVGVYANASLSTYFRSASITPEIAEEKGLFVNGTIISNDSFQISASSKITSAGGTYGIGTNTITSEYTSNGYRSAFYDYFVSSGSNIRSGNITSCWSGSTINYFETVTVDIGNTDQVTMSVIIQTPLSPSPQVVTLQSNITLTGNWTVKAIARYI